MNENYTVAVKLSLINDVSKGMIALGAQFSTLQKQADLFQAKLTAIKSTAAMGGVLLASGAALASPLIVATKMAGNLEQQLKNVQIVTHATNKEMNDFRGTLENLPGMFSSLEAANIARQIALSGNFKIQDVAGLMPEFTKFATVQKMLKGTDYEKSTEMGIKIAEITGHFDPESIKKSLDAFNKLSLIMPGSLDKVLKAFQYAEGTMKNVMGVSDETTMLMVAMLQRMGVESTRAGSSLLSMVSRTIPQVMGSGLWVGRSAEALKNMGLLNAAGQADVFTEGKFDFYKFMGKMSNYVIEQFKQNPAQVARNNIMSNMQFAFGTTGTRLASIFMTGKGLGQMAEINQQYKMHPDLEKTYNEMNDLFNKQLYESAARFKTVIMELGVTLLPIATGALKYFNEHIIKLTNYVRENQATVGKIAKTILAVAGLTALGGTLLLLKAGLTGLLLPLSLVTKTMPALMLAITGISVPGIIAAGVIGAVGYGLYKLYENGYLSGETVKNLAVTIKNSLVDAVEKLKAEFEKLSDMFHYIADTLKTVFDYIGDKVKKVTAYLGENFPLHDEGGRQTMTGAVLQKAQNIYTSSPLEKVVNTALGAVTMPFRGAYAAYDLLKKTGQYDADKMPAIKAVAPEAPKYDAAYFATVLPQQKTPVQPINNHTTNNYSTVNNSTNSPAPNFISHRQAQNAPAQAAPQTIQIQNDIHLDGNKIGTQLVKKIYQTATASPNTGSMFDSSLSPMPTNVNAFGITY
ncbi:hypothetical protein AQUSIP_12890 [Aquicella siphonis]|uniref:Phage tail tape measure protein domain-containing protein n=1 Tax=Aquicella siphonis TaxID=254247 RepID=A0A5E4PHJ0_9COXI|nr:phage tail tape measure protein [Aquicella siphonis]VVC75988.1 hypothetical protein AQUSIP_12890 [Aquicella siphonis]